VDEIYREHFGFVWAALRRLGVGAADMEDVAQEVFIVVHRRLEGFEGRSSLRTWLYAITVRVALNHLRRHQRRRAVSPDDEPEAAAPASADPESHASRVQAGRVLHRLLGRLDEDKRAVFVLAELEGFTAPEIASIVGANPRTVYSRLRVAREQFYAGLARHHARLGAEDARVRWVRDAASHDQPPPQMQSRVWAALLLRWPAPATSAPVALGVVVKSIALSVGIAAATLGVIAVAASPSTPASARASPTATAEIATKPAPPQAQQAPPANPTQPLAVADLVAPTPAAVAPVTPPHAPPSPAIAETPPTPPPSDPLAEEASLLERARVALHEGDAAAALQFADTHADRFPRGALALQRDKTRVQAMCALGRHDDATALARSVGVTPPCET
jgi:RNA polymerase sigma-70 factor (ECF subfamily)